VQEELGKKLMQTSREAIHLPRTACEKCELRGEDSDGKATLLLLYQKNRYAKYTLYNMYSPRSEEEQDLAHLNV